MTIIADILTICLFIVSLIMGIMGTLLLLGEIKTNKKLTKYVLPNTIACYISIIVSLILLFYF